MEPEDLPYFMKELMKESCDNAKYMRLMTTQERFERLCSLSSFGFKAMMADIRFKYPNCTENEWRFLFAKRLHGEDIARKLTNFEGSV